MNNLKIKDFTTSNKAISASDGDKIYKKIVESFEKNEPVILDFTGIDLTITAFLNSSIGRLYSLYNSEQIKALLDIKNLNRDELPLLKFVIENAKRRFNKEYPLDIDNIDLVNEE